MVLRSSRSSVGPDAQFRTLAAHVVQMVWTARADGAWDYANRRWHEYTGLHFDAALPFQWIDALHPDDVELYRQGWARGVSGDEPFELTCRILGADGRHRPFRISAERLSDDPEQPQCWFAMAPHMDDSLADEAGDVAQERFRASVETQLDCFGLFTSIRNAAGAIVDFRIDYLNAAACRNHGRALEEQVGRGLLELQPGYRENGLFEAYCRTVETGRPTERVMQHCVDGHGGSRQMRYHDIRASKLGDGFVAAWRDVTQHWREHELLRATIEDAPVGVAHFTLDGRFVMRTRPIASCWAVRPRS